VYEKIFQNSNEPHSEEDESAEQRAKELP